VKLSEALKKMSHAQSVDTAKCASESYAIDWESGISHIFSAILTDPTRVPGNIGTKKDDEKSAIHKWVMKYKKGLEGRTSIRISNPLGTIADPIIDKIIGARLTHLNEEDLKKIQFAHRLSMSAENILGLILEEYLVHSINEVGWHCAWGETVKAVDFVHEDGRLLQIKNRSNSENSSSSAVRAGTEIKKWYRIKADRIEYMWDSLNAFCGTSSLSEKSFEEFAFKCITQNPSCVAVEQNNVWNEI